MNLKELVISFDSLEQIRIDAADVVSFWFGNVTKEIYNDYNSVQIKERENVHDVRLFLRSEADKKYKHETVFGRLCEYNDITSVELVGESETRRIYIIWDDLTNIVNNNQECCVLQDGVLAVFIGKNCRELVDFYSSKHF